MFHLAKIVHVLAVGLWFGSGMFFTFVVGLSLFDTFETETAKPADERPYWLPVPAELEKPPPSPKFPDPLRKEQGSRIAGAAVGPMFGPYYYLQFGCAFVASFALFAIKGASATKGTAPTGVHPPRTMLTAFVAGIAEGFAKQYWRGTHRLRRSVLLLAFLGALYGWSLGTRLEWLRLNRSLTSDIVLKSEAPTAEQVAAANEARELFGRIHTYSLFANFGTLALVTVAMGMAAFLPARRASEG